MSAKRKAQNGQKHRKILIVDDHPIMRQGLAQLIENEPDLVVCGEAEDVLKGLAAVAELHPDLVLADISLPGKNGLEMIKDIQALHPEVTVLVISMHDESLYAERVLRAGGRGYVMKQEGGKKIIEAIRLVLDGHIYVSERMSARILEIFSGRRSVATSSTVERLTDRELEVFQLIGSGRGTREIADRLHLSVKTVEVHRANIKEKLHLKTATELIRYAVRWVESQGAGEM